MNPTGEAFLEADIIDQHDATIALPDEQDEDEHLKRLAHSRRAHERLYKHERFVKARGTKILVKATWCGPKEWRDTAGQIYRIVEGRT